MKIKKSHPLFWLVVFLITACEHKPVTPPAPLLPVPSPAQMAWHEMETNAFIHFSINTFTDKEWGYGDESPALFNPKHLDADQWVRTLKQAGFKTIILTCKHHDGFCLWPSAYTSHSVKNSPYKNGKGDVVRELSDAVAKNGLKFGIYVSPWDRNKADYGKPAYIDYYRKQLAELFTGYGPISEMWFDGANGGDGYYGGAREKRNIDKTNYYEWPVTLKMVSGFSPNIIFFSDAGPGVRWVGNENGLAGETNWNTISTDTLYAGKAGIETLLNTGNENGRQWVPAEVDVSIRPGWFYHAKEDALVKTPGQLFNLYLSSVGRGSTLLLNVPPDRNGLIHENDVKALQGWKALLDKTFATNVALHQDTKASSFRGHSDLYGPANVTDNDPETYWTTDDDVTDAAVEISLNEDRLLNYIVLQEYIKLGQRIKSVSIEVWENARWREVATATTIGYKRILKIQPITTSRIKIHIKESKACPIISEIKLY